VREGFPTRTYRKVFSIGLVALMLMGSGWMVLAESAPEAPKESRGGDIEPNDVYTSASSVTNDDVVDGSLGNTSTSDNLDYYRIEGGVPPRKVVTATLYLVDYNDSNPSSVNFNLALSNLYGGYYLWTRCSTSSTNRSETIAFFQNISFSAAEQMWICVTRVSGSLAGRYQLSVNISDPEPLTTGVVSRYLSASTGPQNMYFILNGLSDNAGMRLRLQCPSTGLAYLSIYNIWPPRDEWWCQNSSGLNTQGCLQEAHLVGMGGTYFILVSMPTYYYPGGNGTFNLTVDSFGGAMDGDNFPSGASIVNSNSPYTGYIASGIDTADWYRVDMRANKSVSSATMKVLSMGSYDMIDFAAFDKDLKFIKSGYAFYSTHQVDLGSFTTNYTGPLYFAVRAGGVYYSYYYYLGSGSYTVQFQLPNDPPELNGTLPPVVMNEDTPDNSLVLSDYVWDPDGNHINYTLSAPKPTITAVVDRETGRVNFTPRKDWYGTETFKFIARDDGPDQKSLSLCTTVTVNPVNDFPVVIALHKDAKFAEDAEWQTVDLGTIFSDVDDVVSNFTFGCRVTASTTRPPGGELLIKYNARSRAFILGPAHLMYGDFELELNCTDNRPGTVSAAVRFNVTITHVNHDPALKENVTSPLAVTVPERGTNSELGLDNLFTDPDLPAAYAGDALTYTVAGQSRLTAAVTPDRKLMISAGNEQYKPGFPGLETLTITAADKAGRNATLQVMVTVEPVNDPPEIISHQPVQGTVTLKEKEKKTFSVSVSDVDTENRALTYAWYLDGVKDTAATDTSYSYEPDYSQGGQEHKIRVDITDGNSTISEEWVVTVTDVNRMPEGSIKSPINSSKFVKGSVVTFTAEGSDPDGDKLTFTWRDSVGTVIGTGPTFTNNKLLKGIQIIRLEINDGKASVYRDVTITINEQQKAADKGTPGFEAATFMAALGICIAIAAMGRKRR
jgi:hypothetical protein